MVTLSQRGELLGSDTYISAQREALYDDDLNIGESLKDLIEDKDLIETVLKLRGVPAARFIDLLDLVRGGCIAFSRCCNDISSGSCRREYFCAGGVTFDNEVAI